MTRSWYGTDWILIAGYSPCTNWVIALVIGLSFHCIAKTIPIKRLLSTVPYYPIPVSLSFIHYSYQIRASSWLNLRFYELWRWVRNIFGLWMLGLDKNTPPAGLWMLSIVLFYVRYSAFGLTRIIQG